MAHPVRQRDKFLAGVSLAKFDQGILDLRMHWDRPFATVLSNIAKDIDAR